MRRLKTRTSSNSNERGSAETRRRRKAWLMKTWASNIPGYIRCYRCGVLLFGDMVTVDRVKPGRKGGRYVRGNIRPACAPCNTAWNRNAWTA